MATRSPSGSSRRRRLRVGPELVVVGAAALLGLAALGVGRPRTVPAAAEQPQRPVNGFVRQDLGSGTRVVLPGIPWSSRPADDRGPLRISATSGPATLAIWIYPRGREGPLTRRALLAARRRLLAAARVRDGSFRATATAVTRYDGLPAVELRGTARIAGQPRTIRSTHVFAGGREIVIDAYAPDRSFRAVDRQVFRPVLRSLRVAPAWRVVRIPQDTIAGAG